LISVHPVLALVDTTVTLILIIGMANPLLLYSVNTLLAYLVNEHYYNHEHFVWCSPFFDAKSVPPYSFVLPPTSSPSEIYRNLHKEVEAGDLHSAKIEKNRIGILGGAAFKKSLGLISDSTERDIGSIVGAAQITYFKPVIYVIPYTAVVGLVRPPPPLTRAHPFSPEVCIEALPRAKFDIIELQV